MRISKRLFASLVLVSVLAGVVIGYTIKTGSSDPSATHNEFPLLAKRLDVDNPNDFVVNFSGLRSSLNSYFSEKGLNGSLYFEYLPTGTSIRINANQEYRAASLIKLPVAMEFYKGVELGKINPKEEVVLKQEWLNDSYGDLYKQGAGYKLTYDEAVRIMLVDSDNTALRVVLNATDNAIDLSNRALGALDVEFTNSSDDGIYIGARSYSSFLKCLFFACYNNRADSQLILETLTTTKFDNRLLAGIVDKNIKVAHKIGVFNTQTQGDCGIVYVTNRPYVLCIMLNGNDNADTNGHFAELSKQVYEYVTNIQL